MAAHSIDIEPRRSPSLQRVCLEVQASLFASLCAGGILQEVAAAAKAGREAAAGRAAQPQPLAGSSTVAGPTAGAGASGPSAAQAATGADAGAPSAGGDVPVAVGERAARHAYAVQAEAGEMEVGAGEAAQAMDIDTQQPAAAGADPAGGSGSSAAATAGPSPSAAPAAAAGTSQLPSSPAYTHAPVGKSPAAGSSAAAAAAAAGGSRAQAEADAEDAGLGERIFGTVLTDTEGGKKPEEGYSQVLCVDARRYGNVARFINHSCDGNLTIQAVFAKSCRNALLYYVGLYANRPIPAGSELTYDYGYSAMVSFELAVVPHHGMPCDECQAHAAAWHSKYAYVNFLVLVV